MTEAIARLFDTYEQAANAVEALKESGVAEADVSLVANSEAYADMNPEARTEAGAGAGIGGGLGAGAGLLAGLGILAIPGLGPVVAAGWLAATAVGAAAGAVAGGVIGALVDSGVPEADARVYAEGVRRGGTLVSVRTDDPATVEDILRAHASVDIGERRSRYVEAGWPGV